MTHFYPLSDRTRLEIEEGRRMVTLAKNHENVAKLKSTGMVIPKNVTEEELVAYIGLAKQVGATTKNKYSCKICFQFHDEGERCPNSARKYVRPQP